MVTSHIFGYILFGGCFAVILLAVLFPIAPGGRVSLSQSLAALLASAGMVAFMYFWPSLAVRSEWREEPDAGASETWRISPESLVVKSTSVTLELTWTRIRRLVRKRDYLFAYLTTHTALPVPLQQLSDADQAWVLQALSKYSGKAITTHS
jgi:hypothetical protein